MTKNIPTTQHAVQLVGPDQLTLNKSKQVHQPGPHQVLAQVEAVGLCFSDLKLLKQFTGHVRKSAPISGIDPAVLASAAPRLAVFARVALSQVCPSRFATAALLWSRARPSRAPGRGCQAMFRSRARLSLARQSHAYRPRSPEP